MHYTAMAEGLMLRLTLVVAASVLPLCGANAHDDLTERVFAQLKALYECEQETLLDTESNNSVPLCPRSFDGWQCWPLTAPGSTAMAPCPIYLPGHVSQSSLAMRHCSDSGLWDKTMANYTSCTTSLYHDPGLDILYGIAEGLGHYVPWERSSARGENQMWRDKIDRFKQCLRYMLLKSPRPLDDNRSMCYRTWDGWTCWTDTAPGQTAYAPCPRFVAGFSELRKAHKVCTSNGTWFRHPVSGNVWSNYTTCVDEGDLQFRDFVNTLYVVGYTLSSTALLFALFIFCYFRSLRCRRITVHKNLFISFIVNNLCWIAWYIHVISDPDVMERNPIWCRTLHVVTQYFLLCNYLWMFCEGLYLHTLLVVAFIAEENVLSWLLLIGWGFPILPTMAYVVLRGLDVETSDMCWVEPDVWYTYILSITVGLSIMFNVAFLVNIVRVLVTKLRALNSPDSERSRKAVRATIILLPLLGLHYVLTPFRPQSKGGVLLVYEVVSAIVTSLQGLCVAVLFCFVHDEVVAALRQTYSKRLRFRTTDRTINVDTSVTFVPKRP